MAENSAIEWCDHTFNPWIGCTKISPACDNCYAEKWESRWGNSWGPHQRRRTSAANWRKPLAWDKAAHAAGRRARVFCASLADVFDNDRAITSGWHGDLWHLIRATPNLDWLLLTKRPQNIRKMLPEAYGAPAWGDGWPNVWLGTTVENQQEAERRIPHLLDVPARLRFLSCEPLLGPVTFRWASWQPYKPPINHLDGLRRLDWIICGGESGPNARPSHPDWFRDLRDQCAAADVPFFFKQWGDWAPVLDRDLDDPDWRADYARRYDDKGKMRWINVEGGRGFHGKRFHVMERLGKKRAGRLLDGRLHDEFPKGTAK